MKKLKYTGVLFLIALCFSCHKNDVAVEEGIFKLENPAQKWELVAITSS